MGYFHLLTIVKSPHMNLGVYRLFEILLLVLLDVYPEVELLDCMVVLFLISGGTATLFFIPVAPFCSPTNSAQGFQFHPCKHLLFSGFW